MSMSLVPVAGLSDVDVLMTFEGQRCVILPHILSGDVQADDRQTLDGSALPGWCNTIPLVPANSATGLYVEISLSSRVPAMTQLTFLSVLAIRELTGTGVWTVTQVRTTLTP